MNFLKKNSKLICFVFVIVAVLFFIYPKLKEGFNNKPKIYGRDTCPWTIKQKEYFDKKGTSYDYVDCEVNPDGCPKEIKSYPTTMIGSKKLEGYRDDI